HSCHGWSYAVSDAQFSSWETTRMPESSPSVSDRKTVSASASRPARNSKDVGGIRSPVRSSSSAMYSAYNQAMGTDSSPPPVPSVLSYPLCSIPSCLPPVRARSPNLRIRPPVRNADEDSPLPERGSRQGGLPRFDPAVGFTAGRLHNREEPGAVRAARSTRGIS